MSPKTKSQLEAELQTAREQIARLERALMQAEADREKKTDPLKQAGETSQLEEKFHRLLEILPVGVSILNAENKVVFSNQSLKNILQLSEEELARGSYQKRRYLAADGSPMPAEGFASAQAAISGWPVYNVETGIIKEDGETIWTNVSAVPMSFTDWRTVIVTADITERKHVQDELQKQRRDLNALIENTDGSIWAVDSEYRLIIGNELYHQNTNAVLGRRFMEREGVLLPDFPRAALEEWREYYDRALRGERFSVEVQTRFARPVSFVEYRFNPIVGDAGNIVGVTIFGRDISERKYMEASLRESEKRYTLLFQKSAIPVLLVELPEVIVADANEASEALTGYTREELLGRNAAEIGLISHTQRSETIAQFEKEGALAANEMRIVTRSGEERIVIVNTNPLEIGGKPYAITSMQDVTRRKRAEEKLRESEELFRVALEFLPIPIALADTAGRILRFNQRFIESYGYTVQDLPTIEDWMLHAYPDPAYRAEVSANWNQRILDSLDKDLPTPVGEFNVTCKDGSQRVVEIINRGVQGLILASFNDITERKRAEIDRQFQASLLDQVHNGVVTVDFNNTITYWNKYAEELYQWTAAEAVGRNIIELLTPVEMKDAVERNFESLTRDGHWEGEFEVKRKDGSTIPAHIVNTYLKDFNGNNIGFIGISEDITERKRARAAFQESEERFRILFETMVQGVLFQDSQGRTVLANAAAQRILGLSLDQMLGKGISYPSWKVLREDGSDYPVEERPTMLALRTGKPVIGAILCITNPASEDHRWLSINVVPRFKPGETRPYQVYSTLEDITERKWLEELHAKLAERLDLATRSARMGIWDWDIQKNEILWDDQMYALYGLKPGEFGGAYEAWLHGVHPEDRDSSNDVSAAAVRGEREYDTEFRVLWPDGSVHWIKANGQVFRDENGTPLRMVGVNYDITERRRAELELSKSRELFQSLFNLSPVAYSLTKGSAIVDINPACEALYGYSKAEITGRPVAALDFWVDQGERRKATEEFQRNGKLRDFEFAYKTKSGSVGWAISYADLIEQGAEKYVLSEFVNITERKLTENELRRSNAELEQFAYIASHDLQEPLRALTGMVQLLQRRYQGQLDERADEYIGHAVEAAGRMQALIQALLSYSRVDRRNQPLGPVNAGECLQAALRNLGVSIHESHAIVTADDLPVVTADPTQLVQLFQNLVGNSLKFRGERQPQVQISVSRLQDAWRFSVHDNGIGIEPQYFERIFLVFQRLHTRREYPGTGIGLALCKKIVERHGGSIWVESTFGEGSTFYFTLPMRSMDHE